MDGASQVPDRDLLVSDAERNHVVGLLNKAVGHGMLTLDEFTQRTDNALKARTRGELNAVLVDLPVQARGSWAGGPPATTGAVPAVQPAGAPVPGQLWASDRLELKAAVMSNLRREGRWTVPSHLVVRNRLGKVVLDFTSAQIDAQQVVIELYLDLASARFTLPPGSTADTNQLGLNMSDVKNKLRHSQGRTSHLFVITGRLNASSLQLRSSRY